MEFTDGVFFAFVRGEYDRAGCGLLCGAKLFVGKKQPSKLIQTMYLPRCVSDRGKNPLEVFSSMP